MQGEGAMPNITAVAKQFFEAWGDGRWLGQPGGRGDPARRSEGCRAYCTPNASFSAQAEPLAEIRTLQGYADWMKGLLSFMPDGRYAVKSFATDDDRNSVCAYGVFSATHTGQGGPCPPTGKSTTTDYVYVMDFAGDKIRHMTKIWNAGWAMKELGWG
jgi:predicted ester cyclase